MRRISYVCIASDIVSEVLLGIFCIKREKKGDTGRDLMGFNVIYCHRVTVL